MKNVILFGLGKRGQKMITAYKKYGGSFKIIAIVDNNCTNNFYEGIPIIVPDNISKWNYNEIWICTVYFKEIYKELIDNLRIDASKIRYIEYPMPILEDRIRNKYSAEIEGCKKCNNIEMQNVIDYISLNSVRMYCYSFYDKYMQDCQPIYYDKTIGLFYGIYQSKKMYLSKEYDSIEKAQSYFNFVCMEQNINSPHRYLSEQFDIEHEEIGIDIGAAEGIFALQVIDRVKHIYLIESNEDWLKALQATFEPYKDKVSIIKAFISSTTINNSVQLDELFDNRKIDFIKMDIEGEEINALKGAVNTIRTNTLKLAVCTYHHKEDYTKINKFLKENGYSCCHSNGYVICQGEWELEKNETDFRRALLFAKSISE